MIALDHIAVIVSSEESIHFYEKLGFIECKRTERSYDTVVFMQCGNVMLEIFVDPNHPERATNPENRGLRHIAFYVDKFEELNIEVGKIRMDWFGRKSTFIKDPDGILM